jgi:hypothetical protein
VRGLRAHAHAREVVLSLKEIGFTDAQLAQVTDSSESTVAKWRSTTTPSPDARTRLDMIRSLIGYLVSHGVAPLGAYAWITAVDPELDWKTPLYWLGANDAGDFDFHRIARRVEDYSPQEPLGRGPRGGETEGAARAGETSDADSPEDTADPEHALL